MTDLLARVGWPLGMTRAVGTALLVLGILIGLTSDPWYAGVVVVLAGITLFVPTVVIIVGAVERCAGTAARDHPYRVERCPDCHEVVDVRLHSARHNPVRAAERLLEHRRSSHHRRPMRHS